MSRLKKTTPKERRKGITPELKPTIKQDLAWKAFFNPEVTDIFFGGGAGGGKSWCICEIALVQAYQFPGLRSFFARNELKRLMQSTFITWTKVCKHHGIPPEDWKLNGQYNYIEFLNGSRIDLIDCVYLPGDPLYERFGSLEYTNGFFEEAGEIAELAYEVLKTRTNRHMQGLPVSGKRMLTFNPKKGWLYKRAYKPWKDGVLPKDQIFIQALFSDNPYTAQDYGRTLSEIQDKTTKERLMMGNWDYDDDPTTLVEYGALCDMWQNIVPQGETAITCDVARYGSDKSVIMVWRGFEVVHIEWHEKQGLDQTEAVIRTLAQKYVVPWSRIVIDEDGVGGGLVDHMRGVRGFMAASAPIADRLGNIPNYQNLKAQCTYLLADYINSRMIRVNTQDANVKEWIEEDIGQMKTYDADKDGKKKVLPKEKVKEILGRSPDFGDALMMRFFLTLVPDRATMPTTRFSNAPLTRFS